MIEIPGYITLKEEFTASIGASYSGIDISSHKKVLIRTLPLDRTISEIFLIPSVGNEQILSFSHPHLMRVLSIGETNSVRYCVTEYVDFNGFEAHFQRGLSVLDAADSSIQMLSAIHYLHLHQIVHWNINPSHIGFSPSGNVILSLVNFQRTSNENSPFGNTFKEYHYPKLINENNKDAFVDIYSCGMLFYKSLTKERIQEKKKNNLTNTPIDIKSRIPLLPRNLLTFQSFVRKTLTLVEQEQDTDCLHLIELLSECEHNYVSRLKLRSAFKPNSVDKNHLCSFLPNQMAFGENKSQQNKYALILEKFNLLTKKQKTYAAMLSTIIFTLTVGIAFKSEEKLENKVSSPINAKSDNINIKSDFPSALAIANQTINTTQPVIASKTEDKLDKSISSQSFKTVNPKQLVTVPTQDTWSTFMLDQADIHITNLEFSTPKNNNAIDTVNLVLKYDPENVAAKQRIRSIVDSYYYMARKRIKNEDVKRASRYITIGLNLIPAHRKLLLLQDEMIQLTQSDNKNLESPFVFASDNDE